MWSGSVEVGPCPHDWGREPPILLLQAIAASWLRRGLVLSPPLSGQKIQEGDEGLESGGVDGVRVANCDVTAWLTICGGSLR